MDPVIVASIAVVITSLGGLLTAIGGFILVLRKQTSNEKAIASNNERITQVYVMVDGGLTEIRALLDRKVERNTMMEGRMIDAGIHVPTDRTEDPQPGEQTGGVFGEDAEAASMLQRKIVRNEMMEDRLTEAGVDFPPETSDVAEPPEE